MSETPAAPAGIEARFDMGRVIARTFSAVGANFLVYYLLGLVLAGAPLLVMQLPGLNLLTSNDPAAFANPFAVFGPVYFSGLALYVIGAFVLQAAVTHGAVAHFNGQRASFGELLATGGRFFLVALGIAIVAGIGIGIGLVFLFVPGLILMTLWAVAVPSAVIERMGVFGAMGRSRNLTRSHRWAIFALLIAIGLLTYIISLVAQVVGGAVGQAAGGQVLLGMAVAGTLIAPVASVIGAVSASAIYFELRSVKEGVGPAQLASVFD
ncbi:MAG: hypothetical protein AB7J28_17090 [Hyphomonadaceae bacterium]